MNHKKMKDNEIPNAVKSNTSAASTLRALGMRAAGGNFKTLYRKIAEQKLDISHWRNRENFVKGTWNTRRKSIPLEEILVENSTYNRHALKKRLIKENILKNICLECGVGPEWNKKELVLQLDHLNGIFNDNRLENLRLLCPNCHTQTDNFAGKANKKPSNFCIDCSKKIVRSSKRCVFCSNKNLIGKARRYTKSNPSLSKIQWPPIEELNRMIKETSYCAVGRLLGVSDNAVRKHIKTRK